MRTTLDIADTLGRKAIAEAVGVVPTAVSNAVKRGEFPASWYFAVSALAKKRGLHVDPAAFKVKGFQASSPQQDLSSEAS